MKNPFPPVYYYAGKLRAHGCDIPSYIPNHARICETDVTYTQRMQRLGAVGSVMNFPHCPPEKFQWYRPVNQRLLVSRNRREGGYLGWRVLTAAKRASDWQGRNKPGHQRLGSEIMIDTLRQLVKARRSYQATTSRQAHSILDKIIAEGKS